MKRPFASKVQYEITPLGTDGYPLPYFPSWIQDEHPFAAKEKHVRGGATKLRGELASARCLLQPARHWQERGGAKLRLAALRTMEEIVDQGRRPPHLRLPDTVAYVTVQALGIPPSGMVWGKWEILPIEYHAATLALPEDWHVSSELAVWIEARGQGSNLGGGFVPEIHRKVLDYALQPWRLDFSWPHPDWWYEWQYADETKATVVPECLYARWRETPPFEANSLEQSVFTLALTALWLRSVNGVEKIPDGLTVHTCGPDIEYVNAHLVKMQRMGGK